MCFYFKFIMNRQSIAMSKGAKQKKNWISFDGVNGIERDGIYNRFSIHRIDVFFYVFPSISHITYVLAILYIYLTRNWLSSYFVYNLRMIDDDDDDDDGGDANPGI